MKIAIAFLRLLSHLPLRVLYALADICYPVIYYVMGYRRKVVRKNRLKNVSTDGFATMWLKPSNCSPYRPRK